MSGIELLHNIIIKMLTTSTKRNRKKSTEAKKARPGPYPRKPRLPPQMDPPPWPRSPPESANPQQCDHQGTLSPSQPPRRPYMPSPETQHTEAHQRTDERSTEGQGKARVCKMIRKLDDKNMSQEKGKQKQRNITRNHSLSYFLLHKTKRRP